MELTNTELIEWDDLGQATLGVMKDLGNFSPTVHAQNKEVKGYTFDDEGGNKTYYSSDDLRNIASACVHVANWLDARAVAEIGKTLE